MTMAKAASDKNDGDKKKAGATVTVKISASKKGKKDTGSAKHKTEKKSSKKASSKAREGFDGLAKLADHPLVADLLAAGAIAAVAAIAEHQMNKDKDQSSSKMVKSVGKAAAAAMGKKLLGDIGIFGSAVAGVAKKGSA